MARALVAVLLQAVCQYLACIVARCDSSSASVPPTASSTAAVRTCIAARKQAPAPASLACCVHDRVPPVPTLPLSHAFTCCLHRGESFILRPTVTLTTLPLSACSCPFFRFVYLSDHFSSYSSFSVCVCCIHSRRSHTEFAFESSTDPRVRPIIIVVCRFRAVHSPRARGKPSNPFVGSICSLHTPCLATGTGRKGKLVCTRLDLSYCACLDPCHFALLVLHINMRSETCLCTPHHRHTHH